MLQKQLLQRLAVSKKMNKPVIGSEEPQYTGWFDELPKGNIKITDIPGLIGTITANTAFVAVNSIELSAKSITRRIKGLAVAAGEGYAQLYEEKPKPVVCPERMSQFFIANGLSLEPISKDHERVQCNGVVCQGPRKHGIFGKKECGIVSDDNL
jgi:hypothetical protein